MLDRKVTMRVRDDDGVVHVAVVSPKNSTFVEHAVVHGRTRCARRWLWMSLRDRAQPDLETLFAEYAEGVVTCVGCAGARH